MDQDNRFRSKLDVDLSELRPVGVPAETLQIHLASNRLNPAFCANELLLLYRSIVV